MKPFSKARLVILFVTLAATVACDQTSKYFARAELGPFDAIELPGGFGELRLAENPGSFLSLGASMPHALRLVFFIAGTGMGLALLSAYLIRNANVSRLQFGAFALVAAGGVSNVIDRVMQNGLVTDFIFLQAGPLHTGIFNFADVMIMLGVALLLCELLPRRSPSPARPGA